MLVFVVIGILVLTVVCFLLAREIATTRGFGVKVLLFWIGVGVSMDLLLWSLLPYLGKRQLPLEVMLLMGAVFGAVFGAAWRFLWIPLRRRAVDEEIATRAAGPVEPQWGEPIPPEVRWRIRNDAGRSGAYFLLTGIFVYGILARALSSVPHAADASIPGMLLGGLAGLVVAWRFPFSPSRSISPLDPSRRSMWSGALPPRERSARDLLVRFRNLRVFELVHAPYFAILLGHYLTTSTVDRVLPVSDLAWLAILTVGGFAGTWQTGWSIQILEVWWALGRDNGGSSS